MSTLPECLALSPCTCFVLLFAHVCCLVLLPFASQVAYTWCMAHLAWVFGQSKPWLLGKKLQRMMMKPLPAPRAAAAAPAEQQEDEDNEDDPAPQPAAAQDPPAQDPPAVQVMRYREGVGLRLRPRLASACTFAALWMLHPQQWR